MRDLIRPALFLVVRLGLLFSVIACVFGQTWQGLGDTYEFVVGIDRAGMAIGIDSADWGSWGSQEQLDRGLVKDFIIGKGLRAGNTHSRFGGVAIRYGANGYGLGAYHWLIITVAALFNCLLMWVYRQRGKELADE